MTVAHLFAEDVGSAVGPHECERLAEMAALRLVLEVGSEAGRSTIALASTARAVHSVDWHRGDAWAGAKGGPLGTLPDLVANLERYGVRDRVVIHYGRWQDILPALAPRKFGLAFLDAEHGGPEVLAQLEAVRRLLEHGGEVAVHDADQPQVWEAVREFAAGLPAAALAVRTVGSLAEIGGLP